MSIEPDLHATSDAMLANLDRLRELEVEKRNLPFGSPRLVELASEIERLAVIVLGASDTQVDLAKEALAEAHRGAIDPSTTIEDLEPAPRELHAVLSEWRDAERRLSEVGPDTPEGLHLRAQIDVLRNEYRHAHDAAVRRANEPE